MKNPGLIYTFDPYDHYPWRDCVRAMYEDGVRLFSFLLPLPVAWREDGSFDFALLDRLLEEIVGIAPEAELLPRIFLTTPDWWDARHPEELMRFSGPEPNIPRFTHEDQSLWRYETKMYHSVHNPSMASTVWRRDAGTALRLWLEHAGKRFPLHGAMPVYGTCGEWGQFGSYLNGMFGNADFSQPMVKRFRAELRRKYRDDEALRKAWHDPSATLDGALPPSKLERMQTESHSLRSPTFYARSLDYFDAFSAAKADAVEYFCGIVKSVNSSWLAGTFGGAVLQTACSSYLLHSGQNHGLLERECSDASPNIDFLASPNVYFNRRRGLFPQTPAEAVCRRKNYIGECDVRTAAAHDPYSPAPEDSRDQFLMETGNNLCTGSGLFWWYDFGRGWYLADEIRREVRALADKLPDLPRGSGLCTDIAFVISPDSLPLCEGNIGFYKLANKLLYSELPRCNCKVTVMFDTEVASLPPCKLYIFRDKLLCQNSEASHIRHFLKKHQSSAIWLGASGAISPDGIDFRRCESLTGIALAAVPELTAPVSVTLINPTDSLLAGRKLPQALAEVEALETLANPVLYATGCEDAEVLGLVESLDLPGMVCRRSEGRFDLWSATPQLDAELLRRLAREAGITPLFEADAPVALYGNGKLFTLRADRDATVRFPAPMRNALTDEPLSAEFHLGSGETILLREETV